MNAPHFTLEPPEHHTARVLASLDAWLRKEPGNLIEIAYRADGCVASATNTNTFEPAHFVRDNTFIGALANLLQTLEES